MVNEPLITKFCIILRGRTDWEDQGLLQGRASRPLHFLGIEETQNMRDKLIKIPFAAVMTGDQAGSRASADILIEGRDIDFIVDPLLRERDWGEWEGQSVVELHEKYPGDFDQVLHPIALDSGSALAKNPFHEAENFTVFGERLYRCIRETADEYVGKMVLVIMGRQAVLALLVMMGYVVSELKAQSVFFIYVQGGNCRLAEAREAKIQCLV